MFLYETYEHSFSSQAKLWGLSKCHSDKEILCDVCSVMVTGKLIWGNKKTRKLFWRIIEKSGYVQCAAIWLLEKVILRHEETCGKTKPILTHECSVCKSICKTGFLFVTYQDSLSR